MITALLLHHLMVSICFVESNNDPLAYSNKKAIGYCQVEYDTAVWVGMPQNKNCMLDFKLTVVQKTKCPLFNKDVNIKYATKYVLYLLKRYKNDLVKTVSAYNAGHYLPRNKENMKYVRKVLERLEYEKSQH